ncbi:hypothetical protein [uncultured Winogradskyella sp.]|uniref:hypothetical protein n=1 Tax=uncultured Winogradskyella sp. TaxID=395353 RepID=UPI00261ED52C|nr:hypothetical protein [uncultured Winogradskyella sp.]
MKKILTLAFLICFTSLVIAQSEGITYQAVIISPDDLELPGVDSEGNYLPNTTIALRFSILYSNNPLETPEFQEVRVVDTDEFGRINLIIGENNDDFEDVEWDGTTKFLKVEIDFEGGSNFEEISRERLTYVPYALHRKIRATDSLTVEGHTLLHGHLDVELPTNLNSSLNVNNGNATSLSGTLTVDGETNLNSSFNVNLNSPSYLTGDLTVDGNSALNGTLDVIGQTTLGNLTVNGQASFGDLSAEALVVNQSTNLNGTTVIDGLGSQVKITSDMNGVSLENPPIAWHPLLIDGGINGLAIRVQGSRSNQSNFITFYDEMRTAPWGRIEGETIDEFENNADWVFDQSSLEYDIFDGWIDYGSALADEIIAGAQVIKAASDYRPCTGFGACIVTPGPADIIFSALEMISSAAQAIAAAFAIDRANDNKDLYNFNKESLQGVTYASGSGDYAEYLMRNDLNEKMTYGDIVGIKGGKISKNTSGAERMMVVSFKPIVLGNMPKSREQDYEKVAFMGQVPVKVFGKVRIGDYIIPSGKNDGVGIAISPSEVNTTNVKKIVGIAWENYDGLASFNMINVAVGLNRNDNNPILLQLEEKVNEQDAEIASLKNEISKIYDMLAGNIEASKLEALASQSNETESATKYDDRKYEIMDTERGEIIYFEITREDIEKGLKMAQDQMEAQGIDIEKHVFWKKLKTDPNFKNEIMERIMTNLDKQIHYHKEISLEPKN